MISPESFVTAMPSTRLWENENIKSETATLRIPVRRQVIMIMNNDHSLSLNQYIRITETKKESVAGKASREIT